MAISKRHGPTRKRIHAALWRYGKSGATLHELADDLGLKFDNVATCVAESKGWFKRVGAVEGARPGVTRSVFVATVPISNQSKSTEHVFNGYRPRRREFVRHEIDRPINYAGTPRICEVHTIRGEFTVIERCYTLEYAIYCARRDGGVPVIKSHKKGDTMRVAERFNSLPNAAALAYLMAIPLTDEMGDMFLADPDRDYNPQMIADRIAPGHDGIREAIVEIVAQWLVAGIAHLRQTDRGVQTLRFELPGYAGARRAERLAEDDEGGEDEQAQRNA